MMTYKEIKQRLLREHIRVQTKIVNNCQSHKTITLVWGVDVTPVAEIPFHDERIADREAEEIAAALAHVVYEMQGEGVFG